MYFSLAYIKNKEVAVTGSSGNVYKNSMVNPAGVNQDRSCPVKRTDLTTCHVW